MGLGPRLSQTRGTRGRFFFALVFLFSLFFERRGRYAFVQD